MNHRLRRVAPGEASIPYLIGGTGVALLVAYVVETAYFSGLRVDVLLSGDVLVGVLFAIPFASGLVYGGYWLERSGLSERRYRRVGLWCLVGGMAFLALNATIIAVWAPGILWLTLGWLRGALTMGAAIGLLIGISEGRAVESALGAERSRVRARQVEARRELLDYLNALLRHEVLNNSQVVAGNAEILLEERDLDEGVRERLEAIHRQSEDMTRVTEDVRVLIEATRGVDSLRPIDLSALLAQEVADLRETYDAVEVEANLPESAHVLADERVRRVFSNLLANAVEHNDADPARVGVVVDVGLETVTVRVADDGPGVPPSIRESLFEGGTPHPGEHGLGLQLVERLLRRYDGEIELAETGPDGTVFAVELPRSDPGDDGRPDPTATEAVTTRGRAAADRPGIRQAQTDGAGE